MTTRTKSQFIVLLSILFITIINVQAQGILPDVDYSGSLAERSTLTGDWNGHRNEWSKDGIQLDNSLTHVAGFVLDGGTKGPLVSRFFDGGDEETHATWDNVLMLDTEKLGLWSGGLLKIRGEGRVGEGVNHAAGAISPVDVDMLFPLEGYGDAIYDLTEATYMHSFTSKFALVGGILNTLDGDALSLSGSTRGTGQFFNQVFVFNPVQAKTVPYKTLGAGAVFTPTGNPTDLIIATNVMNTEDSSGYNPFSRDEGTTGVVEVNAGSRFFDMPGKHIFGYSYGDATYNNFDDPRIILPGPGGTSKNRSYAAWYSFEQYFHVESEENGKTTGIGLFGRFGFSDGNPNPIEKSYSIGIGGNAPWRARDTFGVGLYYLDMSDAMVVNTLGVEDEKGLELFYNAEITPWLHFTPDFQIINQGLPGTDTAYVLGMRTHVIF